MSSRRPVGTGQLYEKHGAWYGRWRTTDDRRLNRKVGEIRIRGESGGLTKGDSGGTGGVLFVFSGTVCGRAAWCRYARCMAVAGSYQLLGGDWHRHGVVVHSHPHAGVHHHHEHGGHGHSHGLVDRSIVRSREGVRAVLLALLVLGLAAGAQAVVFALTGSVALLADLIHNVGDAATAIPLGIAFSLRSLRAERWAGLAVVLAIFVSACVAGFESVSRLIHPQDVDHLVALAAAGGIGFAGNWLAAVIRTNAGRRLDSPALIADGDHARADAYVSLGVVASAVVVAIGVPTADPLIGVAITMMILRITWHSWQTVHGSSPHG